MDAYQHYRNTYSDKTTQRQIVAADTSTEHANIINPKSANHRIYIQRVLISLTTHADQSITIRDGAGTPVPVAVLLDEATVVPTVPSSWTFDFGPKGFAVTIGEEIDLILSAAGLAGVVVIEAYEKLDATTSYLAGAASQ
jgi:hypothetical protein